MFFQISVSLLCGTLCQEDIVLRTYLDQVKVSWPVSGCPSRWPGMHFSSGLRRGVQYHVPERLRPFHPDCSVGGAGRKCGHHVCKDGVQCVSRVPH